jgi:Holliday junction resolvasome RuvABC endonuclease subunit
LRNEIEEHAKNIDIPIYSYTREQVKDVFEVFAARNKQEIAEWIGTYFPALTGKVPKPKKFYEDEDFNMGIFDALALALTHEYLSK